MAKKPPRYHTPLGGCKCPECGEDCTIVPLCDDFDYADGTGNHTHYPPGWGKAVSNCCEAPIPDAEEDVPYV